MKKRAFDANTAAREDMQRRRAQQPDPIPAPAAPPLTITSWINAPSEVTVEEIAKFAQLGSKNNILFMTPFDEWTNGVAVAYTGTGTPDQVKQSFVAAWNRDKGMMGTGGSPMPVV